MTRKSHAMRRLSKIKIDEMNKKIELDIFNTKMTVAQAVVKGKEFIEAVEIAQMINILIFKQTDNKTSKQIGYILGDVRRFCNSIEHELLEVRRQKIMKGDKE